MTNKILIIGTGGTIACVKDDSIHLDNAFKILDCVKIENAEFDCISPYAILSENVDFSCWEKLIECIACVDFKKYKGVIILHGSDTLGYTGSLIANLFYDKPIVFVAANKPVEDKTSNAIENFRLACKYIISGIDRVYISYDKIYRVEDKPPVENPIFNKKNILVISPYAAINYKNYNLDNVDAVLHGMYHSATAPENVNEFTALCREKGIPFYFVTKENSADYKSAEGFENIIFNSSIESAYARLLLI